LSLLVPSPPVELADSKSPNSELLILKSLKLADNLFLRSALAVPPWGGGGNKLENDA
jgi:hypothetical protein